MRSLFLVSLPRSLSSLVYDAVRPALELAEPEWTTGGEVLNVHRFAHLPDEGPVEGLRYTHPERDPRRAERLRSFLDQVVRPDGFLYKDVVQPFVVASWLPASGLAALRIDRPLADVAWAMLERGWLYPRAAVDGGRGPEWSLIAGLARAQRALAAIPAEVLGFDDLVADEAPLDAALRALYPGADFPRPAYLGDGFRQVRDAVLERRRTERYRWIEEVCREVPGEA